MQVRIKSPSEVSPATRKAVIDAALPEIAYGRVLERPIGEVGLSTIFRVDPGAEAQLVAEAESVQPIYSVDDLRDAIQAPAYPVVLVQQECGIKNYAQLETLLKEQYYSKTVLFVSNAA